LHGKDNIKTIKKGGEFKLRFLKSKLFIIFFSMFFVFNILAYVCICLDLPDTAVITRGQKDKDWIPESYSWLVTSRNIYFTPAMQNSSKNVSDLKTSQNYTTKLYLCGIVPIKTVDVSVVDKLYVTPGGESIGINLKTEGVLVVGIAPFKTKNNEEVSPAKDAGIRTGDIITGVNSSKIDKVKQLLEITKTNSQNLLIEGIRDNKKMKWEVTAQPDQSDGKYKLGLWIRESVAGIGTVSFYLDNSFASLGHPISDIDTGNSVRIKGGDICNASIIGIDKGKKGSPGSLKGVFSGEQTGEIKLNTPCGVYGTTNSIPDTPKLMLASKNEIRPGKASLRCNIGNGSAQSYDIEITRITQNYDNTKSIMIKVTDPLLLSKTGGIVQGMSGSPIIQNGKLIGALTHVFVNDPTRGYAIFIENMLSEIKKVS